MTPLGNVQNILIISARKIPAPLTGGAKYRAQYHYHPSSPSDLPSDAHNHYRRPFYHPVFVVASSPSIGRTRSKEKDLGQTQTLILNCESSDPASSTTLRTSDMTTLAFHHLIGDTHHVLPFTGRTLPPDLLI